MMERMAENIKEKIGRRVFEACIPEKRAGTKRQRFVPIRKIQVADFTGLAGDSNRGRAD
jgi:hypothetical protein